MDSEESVDVPRWYAINTKLRDEHRVDDNLTAWGVKTFAPKVKKRRHNQYGGKPVFLSQSLFPRYIFAWFNIGKMLQKVRYTRGVQSVVSLNHTPLQVEDEIINLIQSRVDNDGFVRLDEVLKHGTEVIVNDGLLKGVSGIFNRATKDTDRVEILLTAINYQATIIVDKEVVRKAGQGVWVRVKGPRIKSQGR